MEERDKLAVPVNVVEQEDFIAGFGNRELLITSAALMLGIILAAVVFISSENMIYAIGAGALLLSITIALIIRDRFDECLIDKVRFVRLYINSQKQFDYIYYNIYEGRQEDDRSTGTKADSKRIYKRKRR